MFPNNAFERLHKKLVRLSNFLLLTVRHLCGYPPPLPFSGRLAGISAPELCSAASTSVLPSDRPEAPYYQNGSRLDQPIYKRLYFRGEDKQHPSLSAFGCVW